MKSLLNVSELTKDFGRRRSLVRAVDAISFAVREGEIVGLLGPNGAGKSTTIYMLLGTLTPTAGSIQYFGKSLRTHRSQILERVAYMNGYSRLPWNLTVEENLEIFGRIAGLNRRERSERIASLLRLFECSGLKRKLAGKLSAGQATRVMLTKAFLSRPSLILLDEPTAALDPDICGDVRDFVRRQRDEAGVSMLYTSHNMAEVADVCDRVIVLKSGRIAAVDTPSRLAARASASVLRFRALDANKAHAVLKSLSLEMQNTTEGWLEAALPGHAAGEVIHKLVEAGVVLIDIDIRRPTLEDFFLMIADDRPENGMEAPSTIQEAAA